MDSTYRGLVASLPGLTTFELVDLLVEIDRELADREANVRATQLSEQDMYALVDEYESEYGED